MLGQAFFWYWFGYLLLYRSIPTATSRVFYVLVSHAITMPVYLGPAESFPLRMLRTTMDVDCPAWLDFFLEG